MPLYEIQLFEPALQAGCCSRCCELNWSFVSDPLYMIFDCLTRKVASKSLFQVLRAQLELGQVRQEIDRRLAEKEEEFDNTRSVHFKF